MYQDLVRATPGLSAADLPKYFKDESFGVKPEDVVAPTSPRDDVTIHARPLRRPAHLRRHDRGHDVRRRLRPGRGPAVPDGRVPARRPRRVGELRGRLGARVRLRRLRDRALQGRELERAVRARPARYGALGEATRKELLAYLDGVNQFIAEARTNPTKMPVEYQALGAPLGPADFEPADIVASSIVLIGVLGTGGGGELQNALALQAARKRFGRRPAPRSTTTSAQPTTPRRRPPSSASASPTRRSRSGSPRAAWPCPTPAR